MESVLKFQLVHPGKQVKITIFTDHERADVLGSGPQKVVEYLLPNSTVGITKLFLNGGN